MRKYLCKFLLWACGWKAAEGPCPGNKAIILGVPHTSAWDFLISFFYYYGVGGKASVMVKKEFFWGPLAPIMRWMGGVPVDRSRGATVAKQVIDAMNNSEYMHLAIAPEGTRKLVRNWKKGFYYIAEKADVPIVLGFLDFKKKELGFGPMFYPTGNYEEDWKFMENFYRGITAKHPEKYNLSN